MNPPGSAEDERIMKISTVKQMRELDRAAIERFGIPEEILMENAGEAAYFLIHSRLGLRGKRFTVVCGAGNNGGDGFVVARKLLSSGGSVRVVLLGDPDNYRGAAGRNMDMVLALGIDTGPFDDPATFERHLRESDVVVDALFGTGLTRNVEGMHREVIDLVNRSGKTVVSLDIPSGISGDTGRVMGAAIKADYTICFGLPKIGNILYPGFEMCGELFVTHISFPPSLYEHLNVELNLPPALPPRNPAGHKGTFGQTLFIAGAPGYHGAPFFAAMSFLKAGGGYARLACPGSLVHSIAATGREIVFVPQEETLSGSISEANLESLLPLSEKADFVVIGPGLSVDPETARLVKALVPAVRAPLLLDGDGITAVRSDLSCVSGRTSPTVLTPHPGELASLTGLTVSDIMENPLKHTRKTAQKLNSLVVLKCANTLIGAPDGRVYVNTSGNSGMGTAGSGDVLTGTVAAMYCLGLPFEEAVRKAVFIHGAAGDIAAGSKGVDGVIAGDILECLPAAVRENRENTVDLSVRSRTPQVI